MMQDVLEPSGDLGQPGLFRRTATSISRLYQYYLDKATPYTVARWVVCIGLVLIFCLRILLLRGWYIVCYALFIYYLNLFLAFLTPKIDPAYLNDEDDGTSLPTKANEEFRPFMRRLPEFKFWYSMTRSSLIAIGTTFFDVFNVPVFWPILVMYFITLFCITMKRQIKHMIRFRYLPFTWGKPKFQESEEVVQESKAPLLQQTA